MHPLETLRKKCLTCAECDLYKERKTAVFGEGPSTADIMLIGEAPGKKEDEEGRPFVGRAGTLLNDVLKKAGIERENTYITNVVKCRPPRNRNPRQKEIKTCTFLYLHQQIQIIDPFLVVTLGTIPLKALVNKTGITEIHGTVFNLHRLYLATFHPAGVMYRRTLFPLFEKDMRKARIIVETQKVKKTHSWVD
jgi:uracil-DNA glycosylase family 4